MVRGLIGGALLFLCLASSSCEKQDGAPAPVAGYLPLFDRDEMQVADDEVCIVVKVRGAALG